MQIVTKNQLIELGIPAERIMTVPVPVILFGSGVKEVQSFNYSSLDELSKSEWFGNMKAAGVFIICEYECTIENTHGVVLRCF